MNIILNQQMFHFHTSWGRPLGPKHLLIISFTKFPSKCYTHPELIPVDAGVFTGSNSSSGNALSGLGNWLFFLLQVSSFGKWDERCYSQKLLVSTPWGKAHKGLITAPSVLQGGCLFTTAVTFSGMMWTHVLPDQQVNGRTAPPTMSQVCHTPFLPD